MGSEVEGHRSYRGRDRDDGIPFANQIERLSALATELVRGQVAAIAGPITSALAARAATTTTPIVFVSGEDPVMLGLMT